MADEETLASLCRRGVTVAFDPVPWSLLLPEQRILPFTSNILKQLTGVLCRLDAECSSGHFYSNRIIRYIGLANLVAALFTLDANLRHAEPSCRRVRAVSVVRHSIYIALLHVFFIFIAIRCDL